jgi:hypothetical protein
LPLGELVDDPHVARVLVGGDPLLDELAQLVGLATRARGKRDGRADVFTQLLVRDADDRGLDDRPRWPPGGASSPS